MGVAKCRLIVRHLVKRLNKIRGLTINVAKIVLREFYKIVLTCCAGQLPLTFTMENVIFVFAYFSQSEAKNEPTLCAAVLSVLIFLLIFSLF